MTRRHDLERHRHSLGEIRSILNSMKTLAYLETRKLARRTAPQQGLVAHIVDSAQQLLAAWPQLLPDAGPGESIGIVIGSERGFCGDFNRSLVDLAVARQRAAPLQHWVLVGRRLQSLWPDAVAVDAALDGASVAEELEAVRDAVVATLGRLRARLAPGPLQVLSHPVAGAPHWTTLLPPFQEPAPVAPPREAPLLQLPPQHLLLELTDQYLFAALNACMADALMAESHQRVMHLERATQHLETQWQELGRRANTLRQEEIIEEIEVILLSAGAGDSGPHP